MAGKYNSVNNDNIGKLRRQYCNEVRDSITRLQKAIQRETVPKNNIKREEDLKNLQKKEIDINVGLYDHEFVKNKEVATGVGNVKNKSNFIKVDGGLMSKEALPQSRIAKPKPNQSKAKQAKSGNAQEFDYMEDKVIKYRNKDYEYYYKQYEKAVETLPDYIKENLKTMPSNKGYIWRGCWYFGMKNAEKNQPCVMFEKLRGGILRIHEITNEHKIYEKNGKEQRKLISSKIRRIVPRSLY
jgi:hypothetical protein